jgi:hypothetical protein
MPSTTLIVGCVSFSGVLRVMALESGVVQWLVYMLTLEWSLSFVDVELSGRGCASWQLYDHV